MNVLTKSIATAITAFAWAATASAESFPIFSDTAGSTVTNKITKATNVSKTLTASSKTNIFMNFAVSNSGITVDQVTAARLTVYLAKVNKPGTLNFSTLNSAFDEGFTTATAPNPGVDAAFNGFSIPATLSRDFIIIDVTAQVKAWLTNPASEFGLAITSDGLASVTIASKEGAGSGHPAVIEVDVNRGGGTVVGTSATFTGTVAANRTYIGTSNGLFVSSFTGGLEVRGPNATNSGILRITGGGQNAALDLTPFDPFNNASAPGARIQATDDGAFSAHLDFLTKNSGNASNPLGNRMRITSAGNVGIGTTSPTQAKVVISGGTFRGQTAGVPQFGYFSTSGVATTTFDGGGIVSLFASDQIRASDFCALSDARMKNILGRSDAATDLSTLSRIEITDYTHKDVVSKGRRTVKKVIAQQIEQVFPQAVSKGTDVVPDIYKKADVKDGWVQLATDLKVGERVKLIAEKLDGIYEVVEVRAGTFRTAFQPEGGQVFVFGREVNDFRAVDYEAIAMLNVSATQELAHSLAAKDAEIATLKKQLAANETRDQALEARLARIEAATPAAPAAQKVSLKTAANSIK